MMRLMKRLLAAALLACYGILGVIATGVHIHEPSPLPPAASSHGPAWRTAGPVTGTGDAAAPRSHCRLCAWSRTHGLPGMAAACEPTPPPTRIALHVHAAAPRGSALRGALLRAPPSA